MWFEKVTKNLQSEKLAHMIQKQVYPSHPFYRRLFDTLGLKPSDIQSVGDLQKLPFTIKKDFANNPSDFVLRSSKRIYSNQKIIEKICSFFKKSQLRTMLVQDYKSLFPTFVTDKTLGSMPVLSTKSEFEYYNRLYAKDVLFLGLRSNDVLVSLFPYYSHLAFWIINIASEVTGQLNIHTGETYSTRQQIKLAQELEATWLIGTPTHIHYFLCKALELGAWLPKLRGINTIGGIMSLELRKLIERAVSQLGGQGHGCVRDGYGIVEACVVAMECAPLSGYHTNPDFFIWECVDERTGESLGPNQRGVLALTNISGNGTILIRYLLNDIAEGGITYDTCPFCGRLNPRIIGPIKHFIKK